MKWRVLDWLIERPWVVFLILWTVLFAVGVTQPDCCRPGPYDDFHQPMRR